MFLPLLFICPPAYFGLRFGASMRHAAVGMPLPLHFALMRAFYGF